MPECSWFQIFFTGLISISTLLLINNKNNYFNLTSPNINPSLENAKYKYPIPQDSNSVELRRENYPNPEPVIVEKLVEVEKIVEKIVYVTQKPEIIEKVVERVVEVEVEVEKETNGDENAKSKSILDFLLTEELGSRRIYFDKNELISNEKLDSTKFIENSWPPSISDVEALMTEYYQTTSQKELNQNNNNNAIINPIVNPEFEKVAIIIPYRNRFEHLRFFLLYNLPIFIQQNLKFKIYVIEQSEEGNFNRAKLLNVGFDRASKEEDWDCYFFHDVDLVIENGFNLYTCKQLQTGLNQGAGAVSRDKLWFHYAVANSKFKYALPYAQFAGSVSAITKEAMLAINGNSNEYWGWGGEDDDFLYRANKFRLNRGRPLLKLGRYKAMPHKQEKGNPERMKVLSKAMERQSWDGLSNLKYTVVEEEVHLFFEKVVVDITV